MITSGAAAVLPPEVQEDARESDNLFVKRHTLGAIMMSYKLRRSPAFKKALRNAVSNEFFLLDADEILRKAELMETPRDDQ